MYMQFITGKFRMDCSKNTIYRFMRSQVINWLKFTTMLASVIINRTIRPLTSADRATAFIIDDSMFRRTGYKSTELASQVFDHVVTWYNIVVTGQSTKHIVLEKKRRLQLWPIDIPKI